MSFSIFFIFQGGVFTRFFHPLPPRDEQCDRVLGVCPGCGAGIYPYSLAACLDGVLFCPDCAPEELPLWNAEVYYQKE